MSYTFWEAGSIDSVHRRSDWKAYLRNSRSHRRKVQSNNRAKEYSTRLCVTIQWKQAAAQARIVWRGVLPGIKWVLCPRHHAQAVTGLYEICRQLDIPYSCFCKDALPSGGVINAHADCLRCVNWQRPQLIYLAESFAKLGQISERWPAGRSAASRLPAPLQLRAAPCRAGTAWPGLAGPGRAGPGRAGTGTDAPRRTQFHSFDRHSYGRGVDATFDNYSSYVPRYSLILGTSDTGVMTAIPFSFLLLVIFYSFCNFLLLKLFLFLIYSLFLGGGNLICNMNLLHMVVNAHLPARKHCITSIKHCIGIVVRRAVPCSTNVKKIKKRLLHTLCRFFSSYPFSFILTIFEDKEYYHLK